MAANIITAAEAYTMRNRVRFASNFQEIQDLSKKAVPFSNVYFNITSYPGIIDIEELLKDWVSFINLYDAVPWSCAPKQFLTV